MTEREKEREKEKEKEREKEKEKERKREREREREIVTTNHENSSLPVLILGPYKNKRSRFPRKPPGTLYTWNSLFFFTMILQSSVIFLHCPDQFNFEVLHVDGYLG